jgi:fermentation-respiration switch protein FrsA (DUF1100 family)
MENASDSPVGSAPEPALRTARTGVPLGWRIVRTLGLAGFVAFLVVVFCAMFLEDSLIYFPLPYPVGDWQPVGLTLEDAWFHAADGTQLHGWYVPHKAPVAVILFCHGNGGNVTHRVEKLRELNRVVGASVLVFDYRGYGRCEGRPNENGVLADARAARAWLAKRAGIAEKELVVMGESLGGAVAVDLAAGDGAKGLILESTFTSVPDVAAHHYPWLPAKLLLKTRFDSLEKISAYRGPLLQSHGDADTIVPYELGRRLFQAANEPKEFYTLPKGDHNDLPDRAYYQKVRQFLESLPK